MLKNNEKTLEQLREDLRKDARKMGKEVANIILDKMKNKFKDKDREEEIYQRMLEYEKRGKDCLIPKEEVLTLLSIDDNTQNTTETLKEQLSIVKPFNLNSSGGIEWQ